KRRLKARVRRRLRRSLKPSLRPKLPRPKRSSCSALHRDRIHHNTPLAAVSLIRWQRGAQTEIDTDIAVRSRQGLEAAHVIMLAGPGVGFGREPQTIRYRFHRDRPELSQQWLGNIEAQSQSVGTRTNRALEPDGKLTLRPAPTFLLRSMPATPVEHIRRP